MFWDLFTYGIFVVGAVFSPLTMLLVKINNFDTTQTIILVGAEIILAVFSAVGIVGNKVVGELRIMREHMPRETVRLSEAMKKP